MDFEHIFTSLNLLIGSILAFIVNMLGGQDALLEFLFIVMITEFFTSLYLSFRRKKGITRKQRIESILQKVGMLWIVVLGVMLDNIFGIQQQSLNTRSMLISFFIGHEGLTIYENYGIMGVGLPNALKKIFKTMQDRGE